MVSELLLKHEHESIGKLVATEKSTIYKVPSERFYEIMGDHYFFTDKFIHNLYQKNNINETVFAVEEPVV